MFYKSLLLSVLSFACANSLVANDELQQAPRSTASRITYTRAQMMHLLRGRAPVIAANNRPHICDGTCCHPLMHGRASVIMHNNRPHICDSRCCHPRNQVQDRAQVNGQSESCPIV